jgi:hypothetical protein
MGMSRQVGFGSFMEGLYGGVEAGQGIRRQRQLDKIYDSGIRKIENEEKISGLEMDEAVAAGDASGGFTQSEFALSDPFGERIFKWFQGRRKAKPVAQALPLEGSPAQSLDGQTLAPQTYGMGEDPEEFAGQGFADGGEVDEEDKKPSGARAAGAATRGALGQYFGHSEQVRRAEPDRIRAINAQTAANPGMAREFLGGLFGGGDSPAPGPSPGPAGAAPAPQALPVAPYNPSRNANPGTPHTVPSPVAVQKKASVRVSGGGGSALPATSAKPEGEAPFDFKDVDPMEVPDYKTRDWAEFRKNAVRGAIARGMPYADAVDKVDQQVIGMQMRGFQNFATQGMALQQAGDLKAAAAAYRAAFQYMPTTSDVKFSIVKGNLVAYGVDEETGQPESRPWLVNPETLSVMAKNFSTPGAWAEHAQDRREHDDRIGIAQQEIDHRNRRLDEYEKPVGMANAASSRLSAEASMTSALRSRGGSGDDGPSGSEMLAGDKDVRELVMEAAMAAGEDGDPAYPELQDQRQRDRLTAAITEVRRKRPDMSSDMILQQILQRAMSGE